MRKGMQIESERLVLKVLDESYADKILDYFIRNRDFLDKWEAIKEDKFYTLEFQKQQLEKEFLRMKEERLFKVWIFEKEDENFKKVIGSIALNEIVRGCFHSCFLGYRLDKDKKNKGYMTEAVKRVVRYGFDDLKIHRIEANIMPHNSPSLSVVKKLGFYNEGIARKYLKINGRWEDHIHMVFLNEAIE
ncbi:MAG: GNAT family N-acetyltransferase [Halanaerobiales bacterium]|nr:GNAT family N-acetyltransferase [Halanaerobiales bacterium]